MKKVKRSSFKLNPLAASIALAMVAQFSANVAQANAGFGPNTNIAGQRIAVPTYFASSPQGVQVALDPVTHLPVLNAAGAPASVADIMASINPATGVAYASIAEALAAGKLVDTGTALRKFVDPLAGAYNGVDGLPTAGIPMGVPIGITEKWKNPLTNVQTTDDFYEIAVVEYEEQMHSDLAKPTRLRGYVQVETPAIAAGLKDITGIIGSEHIPGTYLNGQPILDKAGNQVYFVHAPHYLGPTILASRGTPVRILFHNYLPYMDKNGVSHGSITNNGGEMPLPVDETIAGGGPIFDAKGAPLLDAAGKPIKFSQNRVAIHWHGGDSPWISDGTPHQWFAPAGDVSYSIVDAMHPNGMGKGDSVADVPDMPPSGDGSYTLYFPNNLSGRLMMYHDHVYGLTKLNAYTGEAAGYVVYDPTELTLAANALGTTLGTTVPSGPFAGLPIGLLDAVGIPLVVQDKSFVPNNIGPAGGTVTVGTGANAHTQVVNQSQDTKWDLNHWGQPGDLFFPHVYETNQDPNSADGTNPVGRWDWGPWFWPVFPAQYSLPTGAYGDVTATPEAFLDTPTVNGQAYPTLTVDPKTYRFRILSIGNDRTQDLNFFEAVDANGVVCDASTAPKDALGNPIYATAAPAPGQTGALAACTEVKMVPAKPTAGFPANWPTDGRVGGVPDPATAGPDIVQIGSEGGLLPAPAVLRAQPVTYDYNVRNITVFNILDHGLLLGGGERADVLVDFSKYAGKTLILYNDAPAPMPGYDPRIDYYTGMGDNTTAGGAYDVLPGYGPNTRTVMQFKVNNVAPGHALDVAALAAAMPTAYAATQPKPIIPEAIYNAPFNTADVNHYASIGTGSNAQPYFMVNGQPFGVTGLKMVSGGSGYTQAAATVTFSAPQTAGGVTATGTPVVVGGVITGISNFLPGTGYTNTSPITATFSAPTAGPAAKRVRASATVTVNGYKVINKAIQELFDPVFGRMNATLAVELPFSSATVATTIPLAYVDGPVESLDAIADGETQIWKITHNGVDGHPVHFHMVNVQVINRVGWDGTIKPPEANELGWKETLRMNPLEDVYVAVRAVHPVTPFGLPTSSRLLDPSQAKGGTLGFTQIDPTTGQAPATPYSNVLASFDNEYVWHCHILGHEEFDFMRPFVFHPTVNVPDAPAAVTAAAGTVSWTDTTPFGGQDAQGVPTAGINATYAEPISSTRNEIGFKVYSNGVQVATVPANVTSWIDPAFNAANVYTVVAYNAAGNSAAGTSATATTAGALTAPAAVAPIVAGAAAAPAAAAGPTGLTPTLNADGTVTLAWTAVPGATGYLVTVNGVAQPVVTVPTFTSAAMVVGSSNVFGVQAQTPSGTTAAATTTVQYGTAANAMTGSAASTNASTPVVFTASLGAVGSGTVTLNWANDPANVNNVTGLTLTWSQAGVPASSTFKPTTTGATVIGLTPGAAYTFALVANSTTGVSTPATLVGGSVTAP